MAIFTALAAAFGTLSTFISGLGVVGSALLRIAVGVGLSLLSRALQGNQKQQSGGVNGKLQAGGDVARSIILGRTCTAGSLVYANAWGKADSGKTKNAYFTQVIALADHPVSELKGFWVNGAPVTIDTSGTETDKGWPVTEYRTKKGSDLLWIKFYDGTQTTADPLLTGSVSSADRPYTSDRVGLGVTYAVITSRFNTSYFSGFPTFKFELQGRRLYDPSKDTSVGGDGDQRWNDTATWGGDGDDLPAVQVYNLLRGIYEDDTWVYGLQNVAAARLPAADWVAQINKCRVEKDGEGNGPQFTTGCEVTVDTPLSDTIDKILTGCNGRLIESGGIYKIRVGEPDDAVLSFTDEDIITTEEQSFTPFFGLSETVNGVTATYPEPEEAWNTKAAPPIYNAGYEAEDGDRRLLSQVEMGAVYRSIQVQRLMKSALAEARRARRHTFVLPPKYCVLEPGDVVSWTSERNGYSTKSFRVDGVAVKANLDVVVDLTEVDPADYDWDPNTDYIPPVFSPVGPIFTPPQGMTGWDAEPYTNEKDGKQMPSIQVYFAGQLDDVQFVRIQVRLAGDTAIQFDGTVPYGDPDDNDDPSSVVLQGTFLPNTDYEVRGVFIPYSGRPTYWSNQDEDGTDGAWLSVRTPDVWIGANVYPVDLDQLADDVKEYQDWIGDSVRDVLDELRAVSAGAANQELSNFSDKQELRTELRSESDGITAAYTDAITVATGPTSALSQRITTLEAEIPDLASAAAVSALSARVDATEDGIVSNADAITSLTTTVAGKADASTVSALSSTVSDQGDTITSQGSAITALQNAVNDPSTGLAANAAAVSSLGTTVTSQGDDITANASAITALQASYVDVSAGATFRMGVDYTPSTGWDSVIGLETRVDTGDAFKAAGIYLESTEDDARILFDADQIAIVAGGDVAALFQAGTTFIDAARINKLVADDIEVTGRFDAALILQNGSLITDLIAFGAITAFENTEISQSVGSGNDEVFCITIPEREYATPIDISAVLGITNTGSTVSGSAVFWRRDSSGDTPIAGVGVSRSGAGTTSVNARVYDIGAPAESFDYVFKTGNGGTTPRTVTLNATMGFVWWKR